jgi:hypothetical protein
VIAAHRTRPPDVAPPGRAYATQFQVDSVEPTTRRCFPWLRQRGWREFLMRDGASSSRVARVWSVRLAVVIMGAGFFVVASHLGDYPWSLSVIPWGIAVMYASLAGLDYRQFRDEPREFFRMHRLAPLGALVGAAAFVAAGILSPSWNFGGQLATYAAVMLGFGLMVMDYLDLARL